MILLLFRLTSAHHVTTQPCSSHIHLLRCIHHSFSLPHVIFPFSSFMFVEFQFSFQFSPQHQLVKANVFWKKIFVSSTVQQTILTQTQRAKVRETLAKVTIIILEIPSGCCCCCCPLFNRFIAGRFICLYAVIDNCEMNRCYRNRLPQS